MKSKTLCVKNLLVLTFVLNFIFQNNSFAQGANGDLDMLVSDTKNDLMVVVGAGLAGAVLGLSTLSFVEEPKEHTRNIIVGASVGIILGVGFVAFSQATKTQEMMYGTEEDMQASVKFNTSSRLAWHYESHLENNQSIYSPYSLDYSIRF